MDITANNKNDGNIENRNLLFHSSQDNATVVAMKAILVIKNQTSALFLLNKFLIPITIIT
jgi:hypothetical protein